MLKKRGIAVTLRHRKGDDISAACGQLRANHILGDKDENMQLI